MSSPSRFISVACTAGLAGFQSVAALGAPVGPWSYGGSHAGTLPTQLRVVSATAAAAWAVTAVAVARMDLPAGPVASKALTTLAAVGAVGTVMNAASPSLPERLTWTPVSLAIAVSAWRLRAHPRT